MNTHRILVAFDGSENSLRAVRYTADMVSRGMDFDVGLLYVERLPNRDRFADEKTWVERCREHEAELRKNLDKARNMLLEHGLAEERVSLHYLSNCQSPSSPEAAVCSTVTSVARDILDMRKSLGFDTIVIGRRGVSKAEEFLFGSVSNKILHTASDCAVWVVA